MGYSVSVNTSNTTNLIIKRFGKYTDNVKEILDFLISEQDNYDECFVVYSGRDLYNDIIKFYFHESDTPIIYDFQNLRMFKAINTTWGIKRILKKVIKQMKPNNKYLILIHTPVLITPFDMSLNILDLKSGLTIYINTYNKKHM